jgi:transcriptional regulator PpsR
VDSIARSIADKQGFRHFDSVVSALDAKDSALLAIAAGDITLLLNAAGRIVDASANIADFPDLQQWVGSDWSDTVTVESRAKVAEMVAAAKKGESQRWRQVNHPSKRGDIPVRYLVIGIASKGAMIAIGRDMRDSATLQQRLLQTQQSLERDYLRLRQVETLYRLLFERSTDPLLIVDGDSYRIRDANPAAHALLKAQPDSLAGVKISSLVAKASRDPLVAFLGASATANALAPTTVKMAVTNEMLTVGATGFRQGGAPLLLVRLSHVDTAYSARDLALLDVVEHMPDAFVLTDADFNIVTANAAFVELVQAASEDQLRGHSLNNLIGRPGVDLDLIEGQLARHGEVRNVGTVIRPRNAIDDEPVEISAVRSSGNEDYVGFSIRRVGRRLRDLPPAKQDLPRSVEELTELVGRMALKDIVRESTDLIERLCIEAALVYTSDNRASAAEILGLSRQSLYAKLHRYGLGNLLPDGE